MVISSHMEPSPDTTPGLLAIVAYDQLRTFEYAIAAEVFALPRPSLGVRWYPSVVLSPDRGRLRGIAGVEIRTTAAFERIEEARTIVLPGWRDFEREPPRRLLDALRRAHARGARLLSICSGSWVLACAGLLDGGSATTHWLFTPLFRERFPRVVFADDVLYVDAGQIITSSGSAAGIDACLHLVRRDYGARIANQIARRMVTAPHRDGGQAQYVETPMSERPERSAAGKLGQLLGHLRAHLEQPWTLATMAQRALLSERSFVRQFRQLTGVSAQEWLQRERVARARELLEGTALDHDSVATRCGYSSLETFRVAFRRVVGVAPGVYRQRFAGATG